MPVCRPHLHDRPEQALARPPIAQSLAEFFDRFAAAAGTWYWEAPKPLAWYKDPDTPGLWQHGLGLSFALYKYSHDSRRRHLARRLAGGSTRAVAARGFRHRLLVTRGEHADRRPPGRHGWAYMAAGYADVAEPLRERLPPDSPPGQASRRQSAWTPEGIQALCSRDRRQPCR